MCEISADEWFSAPNSPDFSLTFNAHSIHLDPLFTREVEGYRNRLLHGPLSLTCITRLACAMLKEGEMVQEIEYRNLAPLYAEEPLKVCGRVEDERSRNLELWIENAAGGYSVRGLAKIRAITG